MENNFVLEVEALLGVKVGEVFEVKGLTVKYRYYFDDELRVWSTVLNNISNTVSIRNILNGEFKIIKLPFEPKQDEEYWYVTSDGEADENVYTGSTLDKYCAISGNRFRTEDDATNNAPRIMKEVFGNELP